MPLAGWVVAMWDDATSDIELTPNDYLRIAKETEAAARGKDRRRDRHGAPRNHGADEPDGSGSLD
jgi:hypothetical protein